LLSLSRTARRSVTAVSGSLLMLGFASLIIGLGEMNG
jgi:hypothetical protein